MENPTADYNAALINSFCEITSSSKQEALFFLESHQWNLDSAVSTFLDTDNTTIDDIPPPAAASLPIAPSTTTRRRANSSSSPSSSPEQESHSPNYSPSHSPSRSRSPSPPPSRPSYSLRSRGKKPAKPSAGGSSSRGGGRGRGGIRTLADLNRKTDVGLGSDDDEDDDDYEPQEYYTGGEKSGMLVQDPTKGYNAEGVFNQARNSGAVERPPDNPRTSSSSRSFAGTGRLLSGETVPSAPQPPEAIEHTVTLWRNGFTVDDGPLRRFDDPANASFLESIKNSECPLELEPADRRTKVHLDLMRREENYSEPEKSQASFQGVGRTLASTVDVTTPPSGPDPRPTTTLRTAALPTMGLVVDSLSPTTSLQLRLADGTRMVSRFNLHHTIRDLRAFIDASRPGGERNYQLQTMGFPPKQLVDPEQTIEQAGIANSVVIQKF